MSDSKDLICRLESIFGQVAENKNIKNFKINLKLAEQSKDGFLSEMHFGSIVNQDTGKEYFLISKKQFDNDGGSMETFFGKIYQNEIYFYDNVLPIFQKFQKEKNVINPFHEVPKCILTSPPPKAYLVLENIAVEGFKMWEKALAFPEEYLELIFKTYGKFHGISFAMRDQNPEEYEKLARNFVDLSEELKEWRLGDVLDKVYKELKISHKFAAEKIEKYRNYDMREQIRKVYEGKYKCIIHGDCWSNNMLFKYSEDDINKVHDIRLIDFQMSKEDTPIHDLTYFFYTGSSKKHFDKLDHYLKLYHDSFSTCLSELGSDATELFPFEKLKSEWIEHCKFGFLCAATILRVKFSNMENIKKNFDGKAEIKAEMFQTLKCDEEKYNKRMTEVILHLCDIGGL